MSTPRTTLRAHGRSAKYDIPVSFLAGLTYTYNDRRVDEIEDVDDIRHSSLTVTGGLANYLNNMDKGGTLMPIGRISYAQWHAPALGWRVGFRVWCMAEKPLDLTTLRQRSLPTG